MPQPTKSAVHIDKPLTNLSVAHLQSAENFIATRVFPPVPVTKQSDKFFTFTRAAFFRDDMDKRAPGDESAGSGYEQSSDSYFCDVYALHKDIDDYTRANYDQPLDPDRNAAQYLTQNALQRVERQWVTDFFTTSVWTTDSTPTNLWSDYTSSDPIDDVETGKNTILKNTGFEPNTLVLGYEVFRKLKHHPDVVDRIKYTSSQAVTSDMLGAVFEIPRVFVAKAVKNTAVEGATASYDYIYGKHALLCYSAPAPGVEVPSAGYVFQWTEVSGGMGAEVGVSVIRIDEKKSDRVEIEMAWDNKKVSADLGYFFNGAVA